MEHTAAGHDRNKKSARRIVSRVILETMRALRMSFPKPDAERRKELRAIRKALMDSQGN